MKLKLIGFVALALAVGVTGRASIVRAHEGHDHDSAAAVESHTETVEGEILDMACYMSHEAKGKKHASCAKQCAKGGAPLGLLTEHGDIYLLVNDHEKEKAYQDAKNLAGEQAKITGKMSKRGGLSAIIVEEAKAKN